MAAADSVYILITQCLQNNFFLAHENRLCLPDDIAMRLLINNASNLEPRESYSLEPPFPNRRQIAPSLVQNGPLYAFLNAVIDSPDRENALHVIHIKDWHQSSDAYDGERRAYGAHCEAGTWEAEPIDGFDKYLQPWKGLPGARARAQSADGYQDEKTTYYEVLSDSLFDFRPLIPRTDTLLAQILDKLLYDEAGNQRRAYIVVIGVLTDIKIKTLLTGLRCRYQLNNLLLSDALTASMSLERHLSGLDFAEKVLTVEIVHGLNDLVSALNPSHTDTIPEAIIKNLVNFRNYRTYYLDKQNVLAYQDEKLMEYVELTAQRGAQVYEQVFQTNRRLTWIGYAFLVLAVILGALQVLGRTEVRVELVAITGGLGMVQLIAVFFNRPLGQMQENLNNLVRLRNYLETYSTITALLRHHLTTPENLQKADLAELKTQMEIVQSVAAQMAANFKDIQIGAQIPKENDPLLPTT